MELSAIDNINVVELDVTDGNAVQQVVSGIIKKEGQLDVLVNNAGYFGGGLAESYDEYDLEKMFDVNVKRTWRLIKASLPQMRKQGEGLIVNTSSGLGRFSAPFMTVYNGTKFAVEGLTEGLHYEVRPLRTDVDGMTGEFVEKANAQVKEQYNNFLTTFGMKEMLN